MLLSLITTAITIVQPVLWGKTIDIMVMSSNKKLLLITGIIALLLGFFSIIIGYLNNKLYIIIQTKSAMDISADVIHHLHHVSLTNLQKFDAGYLNESINHDSNSITMFFLSILTGILTNVLLLIIPLFIIFRLAPNIVVLLLIMIIGYIVLYLIFRKKIDRKSNNI